MDAIVVHDGSWLYPKRIDATHVRGHALTDHMDMVEADIVVMGIAWPVTPSPAHGYAGLIEVEHIIVLDRIEGGVADPDT